MPIDGFSPEKKKDIKPVFIFKIFLLVIDVKKSLARRL